MIDREAPALNPIMDLDDAAGGARPDEDMPRADR